MRKHFCIVVLSFITAFNSYNIFAQTDKTSFKKTRNEFSLPSDSARTKLWWFHGETETTREGITADLEAFKREGIGGVVYYDQVIGKGEHALPALSKEWWDMFRFAASEAKRLGLSFESHLSNGYVSGGPWITEELSMQRLVATDTLVNGGQSFNDNLPAPAHKSKSGIVRDVAVLAFPVPAGNWETSLNLNPKVSGNNPQINVESIFSPSGSKLPIIPGQKQGVSVFLNLEFNSSFTARTISYRVRPRGKATTGAMNVPGPPSETFFGTGYQKLPDLGQLEVSEDGINYTKVCDLKPIYSAASGNWNQKTISFPVVKGKYFRLNLHDWCNPKDAVQEMQLGNVILSAQAKMDQWEEKAALYSEYIEKDKTPDYSDSTFINPKNILDISSKMNSKGQLKWSIPAGRWVIMRFVRVPTGVTTKHSRSNMEGLESDKLSAIATKIQWNNYFKVMLDSLKKEGLPLSGLAMDSHEAGSQNWTSGFEQKFMQHRGYDIHKYLPALMGLIVGSKDETNGFLYDMRRTIADMISDEYFGTLDSLCRQAGVNFTAQATGNGLSLVSDGLQSKGRVQKPQGEFWGNHTNGSYDIKEASSAAHVYGKQIASAESFTEVKLSQSFADIKNLIDYAYAFGVNEFVVCASSYQPWLDKIPGNTGGGREYYVNRNNPYWNYSRPFWDYQARCAGLMRNGLPVADLCIYLGENPPIKLVAYRLPEIPEGYDFDVCTKDALINRMSSKDGHIALPDGMSYQMLVLERNGDISLEALRKIAKLVKDGVPLYGARPTSSGSLHDAPFAKEYQELVSQLWGTEQSGSKVFGKGKVYWGITLAEAFSKQGLKPDVGLKSGNTPTDKMFFAHRHLVDTDIYFLNNHSKSLFNDTIRLRTNATNAEYWDPVTGQQYKLPVSATGKNGLFLKVVLKPNESGFIVASGQPSLSLQPKLTGSDDQVTSIEGEWKVSFDPKWGGPGEVTFTNLTDWTENADKRIKYYSGTAVYRKTIQLDKPISREHVLLRFQQLGSIARVIINGKEVAIVWCTPWEADLTPYVQKGENTLEIQVVNSLINRMIGDAPLPQSERFTYAFPEVASAKDRLVPSGIMDKVLLVHRSR